MPIVVTTTTSQGLVGGCGFLTPTAQQVVNSVSTDLLQRIAPEDPILLDYINRVQLQLLRVSRWKFLLSAPQRFVTKKDRTDYWIGPVGSGPIDTVDTGLNIANLGNIKTETFFDRSNFRLLKKTDENILSPTYTFRDASSRPGQPRMWRNAPDTPCLINLYPGPDNQNIYQPSPEAPVVQAISGGALPGRIYFVRTTFIDSLGNESSASDESRIFIPANNLLVVQPPQEIPTAASGVQYNRFNVYAFNNGSDLTANSGQETLVTTAPLSTAGAYQEPPTGFLTGGTNFPTANAVESIGGYLIEFRYFQAKPQVQNLSTNLLIPTDYFDILVAGVNRLVAQFLKEPDAVQYWNQEWQAGMTAMIRDKNLFPRGPEYISPDRATINNSNYWGYETDPNFVSQGSF